MSGVMLETVTSRNQANELYHIKLYYTCAGQVNTIGDVVFVVKNKSLG